MFLLALAVFILLPPLELALMIEVGKIIGAGATVGLVILTGLIGVSLVRWQGINLLVSMQREIAAGRLPAFHVFHGVCILLAGALLLTPGFITDTVGFLLLVPPLRNLLLAAAREYLRRRMQLSVIDVDLDQW